MLNSIAFAWIQYWVFGPWTEGGFQLTEQFPIEAWLPRLSDFAEDLPGLPRPHGPRRVPASRCVRRRSSCGGSSSAARWATRSGSSATTRGPRATPGIPIARIILLVFAVSGGLAGIAGMAEVSGVVHRLQDNFSPGYGYTAIIVAYLAKFHPLRVVPSRSCSGRWSSRVARSSRPGSRR